MKKEITVSAEMMGLPQNLDMNILFSQMDKMVGAMREQLDKQD